jgi:hypothetical protein
MSYEVAAVEVFGVEQQAPSDQTILLSLAASGPVAFGPIPSQSTITESDFSAKVYTRTAPSTLVVDLDESFDRNFQDQLSNTGSGSLSVMNDDTDLASVNPGDLIRMQIKGVTAWTMLAREFERMSLSPGEESEQFTTISGPGILSVLDEAVIYPALGLGARPIEEDRVFNWSSSDYNAYGWIYANEIAQQGGSSLYYTGIPVDWPDPTAYWIWGTGSQEIAAPGHCYFRKFFTVPAGVYKLLIYLTGDAQADLFFDGARLITTTFTAGNPTEIRTATVDVTPGTHLIAIDGLNDPDPEGDGLQNPGSVLMSCYATDTLGTQGALLVNTDSTWLCADYPANPPGMSPGEVLRIVIDEAQARGALTGVTLDCDDLTDSNGNVWPFKAAYGSPEGGNAEVATKIGTSVLAFVLELAGTYIDVWMSPTLRLYAWAKGTRGATKSVTYAATTNPDTSNLAGLTHTKVV